MRFDFVSYGAAHRALGYVGKGALSKLSIFEDGQHIVVDVVNSAGKKQSVRLTPGAAVDLAYALIANLRPITVAAHDELPALVASMVAETDREASAMVAELQRRPLASVPKAERDAAASLVIAGLQVSDEI